MEVNEEKQVLEKNGRICISTATVYDHSVTRNMFCFGLFGFFLTGFGLKYFVKEAKHFSLPECPLVLLQQQVVAGYLVSVVPKGDSWYGNSSPDVDLLIEAYFRPW